MADSNTPPDQDVEDLARAARAAATFEEAVIAVRQRMFAALEAEAAMGGPVVTGMRQELEHLQARLDALEMLRENLRSLLQGLSNARSSWDLLKNSLGIY